MGNTLTMEREAKTFSVDMVSFNGIYNRTTIATHYNLLFRFSSYFYLGEYSRAVFVYPRNKLLNEPYLSLLLT